MSNYKIQIEKDNDGRIKEDKFLAFLKGYQSNRNIEKVNWETVLSRRYIEPIEWLEYSLKRSLGINCDDEQEKQTGTDDVFYMIEKEIIPYAEEMQEIISLLDKIE